LNQFPFAVTGKGIFYARASALDGQGRIYFAGLTKDKGRSSTNSNNYGTFAALKTFKTPIKSPMIKFCSRT
jgi:hypothetical protein